MKDKVLLTPDPEWVIVKSLKYNGDEGYWYLINHQHLDAHQRLRRRSVVYYSVVGVVTRVRSKQRCVLCNVLVPQEMIGFRNLVDWSEV